VLKRDLIGIKVKKPHAFSLLAFPLCFGFIAEVTNVKECFPLQAINAKT
jgi:TRAP-type mannitol/chloroaromatic compound transport system permease large subunit